MNDILVKLGIYPEKIEKAMDQCRLILNDAKIIAEKCPNIDKMRISDENLLKTDLNKEISKGLIEGGMCYNSTYYDTKTNKKIANEIKTVTESIIATYGIITESILNNLQISINKEIEVIASMDKNNQTLTFYIKNKNRKITKYESGMFARLIKET